MVYRNRTNQHPESIPLHQSECSISRTSWSDWTKPDSSPRHGEFQSDRSQNIPHMLFWKTSSGGKEMSVSFGIYLGSSSCCIAVNKVLKTDIFLLHDLCFCSPVAVRKGWSFGRALAQFLVCFIIVLQCVFVLMN